MIVRCPDCHEMAEAIVVDNGIGAYEYWGARCIDSQPEVVSNCCEAFIPDVDIDEVRGEPDYDC